MLDVFHNGVIRQDPNNQCEVNIQQFPDWMEQTLLGLWAHAQAASDMRTLCQGKDTEDEVTRAVLDRKMMGIESKCRFYVLDPKDLFPTPVRRIRTKENET